MKMIGRKCNKLYRRLGITRSASQKAIKTAYREMAREVHPDAGGSDEDFIKVQEAYRVLSDKSCKRHYDQTGEWLSTGIPEQTRVQQRGNDVLAQLFSDLLTKKKGEIVYIDVVQAIKQKINQMLKEVKKQLEEIEVTQSAVDVILELIEHDSDDPVNVFEGVLLGIARENEVAKSRYLENKEGFTAALKLIDDYKFNFRTQEHHPASQNRGSQSHTLFTISTTAG